jgi:hypothetical protein
MEYLKTMFKPWKLGWPIWTVCRASVRKQPAPSANFIPNACAPETDHAASLDAARCFLTSAHGFVAAHVRCAIALIPTQSPSMRPSWLSPPRVHAWGATRRRSYAHRATVSYHRQTPTSIASPILTSPVSLAIDQSSHHHSSVRAREIGKIMKNHHGRPPRWSHPAPHHFLIPSQVSNYKPHQTF